MGFVGGGGLIAITTALPPIIVFVLYCKHFIVYDFLYLIFNGCMRLCSNVRSLAGNGSDLTVSSSQYDILLC